MHSDETTNIKTNKEVVDNKVEGSHVIEDKIPDFNDEMEVTLNTGNTSTNIKSHEKDMRDLTDQGKNQQNQGRISINSSMLNDNKVADLDVLSSDFRQSRDSPTSLIFDTINTNNPNSPIGASETSKTSHSARRDEENGMSQSGHHKEPYRSHKTSHRLTPTFINPIKSKVVPVSGHEDLTHKHGVTNRSSQRVSIQAHKISAVNASEQPVVNSKIHRQSNRTEPSSLRTIAIEPVRKEARESQAAEPVPHAVTCAEALHEGRVTAVHGDKVPTQVVSKDKPKPTEKSISKKCPSNANLTEGLSGQTLYVRATKRLPTIGSLSINDLDDFLKKSKVDFEHFYHKKPVSSVQITDFNLMKTLGVGAFGKVVLGELKTDKTLYAVKIIDKVGVIKRNHVRYVSNEKRILQALNFPFVIHLKYFFTDLYYLYFAMPYVPGGNFSKHLKICKKIKESDAKFYIGQLVLALEYLHYLELIHRDVKTENIMIDAFGYLKLVDFGQCIRCYGLDKTWTFTGTPEYMAPEIIVGKGYDCAVDWWSLGVITFEICAGFRPFRHENSVKLQLLILCNQYSTPSGFSRPLKKFIECLLVLEPKKRIATYGQKASVIKKHNWFKEMNWLGLFNRTLEAPYLPKPSQHYSILQKDQ